MAEIIGIALWALIPGFVAKKKGRNFWGYYFLSFLLSPLITMIITFCLSNLNEATPIESTSINVNNVDLNESYMAKYCRKCGNTLLERAKFCNKCGIEVMEDISVFDEENNNDCE